jgi:hypothetical protein
MSIPPDSPNPLEARLERAARNLDVAAEQYAHRRTPVAAGGSPHTARIRRMTGIASIAGIAAAVLLVGSIVRDQRQKNRDVVAIARSGANPQTFPFIGELTIPVPAAGTPNLEYVFQDGTAVAGTQRLTIQEAVDVDTDSDGTLELALLIKLWDSAKNSKPRSEDPSSVGIYRRSDTTLKLLASTQSAERIDALGVLRGNRVAIARQTKNRPNLAVIRESVLQGSTLTWTPPGKELAVTDLETLEKSSPEIRFRVRTTSGLIIANPGKRAGWFRAKAGQVVHTDLISVPTETVRTLTIRRRGPLTENEFIDKVTLPQTPRVVLPADGEYEVLVGDGDTRVAFELTIDPAVPEPSPTP